MAVNIDLIELKKNPILEPLPEPGKTRCFHGQFLQSNLAGLPKSHNPRHIESTGAHSSFVATPVNDRAKTDPRFLRADI